MPLSLYVHFPWCIKKCPYCDFNSHAIIGDVPEKLYIDALLNDLKGELEHFDISHSFISIFMGGGTPSLFSPEAIERLLTGINNLNPFPEAIEITLEANPGSVEANKFREFYAAGINRLSIGIQSFNDLQLRRLGRVHSASDAIKAAEIATLAGFSNFNIDLMFGLPDSTLRSSIADVKQAIALAPTHISYYQLTLEANTYFAKFPPALPDTDNILAAQIQCQELLLAAGYRQYEVSAYSLPQYNCQHNLNYWQFGDYLGIGAGAHGKVSHARPGKILRKQKIKSPEGYLNSFGKPAIEAYIPVAEIPLEYLMNQLRLKQGFTAEQYQLATGLSLSTLEPALTECIAQQLLQFQNNYFRCSEKGWDLLDSVLEKFIQP